MVFLCEYLESIYHGRVISVSHSFICVICYFFENKLFWRENSFMQKKIRSRPSPSVIKSPKKKVYFGWLIRPPYTHTLLLQWTRGHQGCCCAGKYVLKFLGGRTIILLIAIKKSLPWVYQTVAVESCLSVEVRLHVYLEPSTENETI